MTQAPHWSTTPVAPPLLRQLNQRALLDHLLTGGAATRPQLARECGLSQPTVIAALDDLVRAGLVRPATLPSQPVGRPAAAYEADPTAGSVMAIDIGRDWLHLTLDDLSARELSSVDVRNTARSSAALVDLIGTAFADTLAAANHQAAAVTHTVIGSPGVLDQARGRVLYAANLPGWHRAGLAKALTQRLGGTVSIDNDANLAALGEHTHGAAQNTNDFVYIHIGTGIGMGIFLNGRLYRGSTGAAGEIGYLPIGDIGTAHATTTRRGILEEALSADAVVRYARDAGMPGRITAQHVFTQARQQDPAGTAATDQIATRLAQLIASTCAFLDPELIVIGGGVGQNLDLLLPATQTALQQLTPMQPTMTLGQLGPRAVIAGALAHGLHLARETTFLTKTGQAAAS